MTDKSANPKSFRFFAILFALSSAAHVATHLPQASFSASWGLGVAVFLGAMWLIHQTSVRAFLVLSILQIMHVIVDAPYNPDHWLLVFFVNLAALWAASKVWRADGTVTPERFMEVLTPAARLLFVVCYGFAAFAKYNTDFLFSENSVARELLGYQIGAVPTLSWLVWPPAVAWITLVCETAVPVFLFWNRTRYLGILVGVFFHAALIISPAVKVFDFTILVYTMLYLFSPDGFEARVQARIAGFRQQLPALARAIDRWQGFLLITAGAVLIAVSTQSPLLAIPPQLLWARWMVVMLVVTCIGGLTVVGLLSGSSPVSSIRWWPRSAVPYAIVALALLNGLCPYLGLKTQGSFTMFSNLRTEAGDWNHLIMPSSVRVADQYQDRLVRVLASNDPVLNKKYVERDLLATEFELRRRIMDEPSLGLTVERDGQQIVLEPAIQDEELGEPLGLLPRKLLIFRPVSPDGRPFMSN